MRSSKYCQQKDRWHFEGSKNLREAKKIPLMLILDAKFQVEKILFKFDKTHGCVMAVYQGL